MKKYLNYIITAVGFIFALLFLQSKRNRVSKTLIEQEKLKNKLDKMDESIKKNEEVLATEEEKRKKIIEDFNNEKKDVSNTELVDFFNKLK